MAIINFTGFETGDTSEVESFDSGFAISQAQVRSGAYSMRINATTAEFLFRGLTSTGGKTYFDTVNCHFLFHLYVNAAPSSGQITIAQIFGGTESGRLPLTGVGLNSSGQIIFTYVGSSNGFNTVGTSDPLPAGWNAIEIAVHNSDTPGGAEVALRINGEDVFSSTGLTLRATQVAAAFVSMGAVVNNVGADLFFDDVAVADGDEWIGDGRALLAVPVGAGTYSGWTDGTGSTFAEVDEVPHDSATSYIQNTAGTNVNHSFAVTPLADLLQSELGGDDYEATIGAVKVQAYISESTSTSTLARILLRSGSTDDWTEAADAGTTSWEFRQKAYPENPDGDVEWDEAAFDGIEVGVGKTSDSSGVRASAIYALVWVASVAQVIEMGAATETEGATAFAMRVPLGQAVETEAARTINVEVPVSIRGLVIVDHEIHFRVEDDDEDSEVDWEIANQAGTVLWSGSVLPGVVVQIPIPYAMSGLTDGLNRLSLTVTTADEETDSRLFLYRQVSIDDALRGRFGAVRGRFEYELRNHDGQFLQRVTNAVLAASGDLNNDRDITRTLTIRFDPNARDDRGQPIEINTDTDHIYVGYHLIVDGFYDVEFPLGIFHLDNPRETWTAGMAGIEVTGSDLGIHLIEDITDDVYTVAAGQNYLTGTNAVTDILDAHGLRHALPSNAKTLTTAKTWPIGTPWIRVVNELLHDANFYSIRFDARGRAVTRERIPRAQRSPDTSYSSEDMILSPVMTERDTTRFANRIVATMEDPQRTPLRSVATNSDPDSPISTVALGRTITKLVRADGAADQTTLDAIALAELDRASEAYRRMQIQTFFDPRRGAFEVYELDIEGHIDGEKWWARNWLASFEPGAPMVHNLSSVESLGIVE